MKNLAAIICLSVCAVSVGINTARGKWLLAFIYGALAIFFYNAVKTPEK